jgi:hypothetical protein
MAGYITGLNAQVRGRMPLLRERILRVKLVEIQKVLQLDQTALDRFKPIYASYEKEMAGINFQGLGGFMRVDPDSLTGEEAEKMVLQQMENTRKTLALREKYYYEFKTVLTPQQIIRLYQVETEIRQKVMREFRRRFGE